MTNWNRECSLRYLSALAATAMVMMTSGCAVIPLTQDEAVSGVSISGRVHGGQQPVSQSKVYLYAASNAGYSAAATSLIGGAGYATTDSSGTFSITGTYPCPAGAYVYLLSLGGNPGLAQGTNNPKLALMTGLGPCSALSPSTVIPINEVTTVATAYSLAQFMSSETLVGTSSTNAIGMQNAFATINNLFNAPQGLAVATTPAGNGAVPQAEINSLANALAACVNTDGTGAPCSTLMTAANVTGAGGTPIDTIQAAINIAHNPGVNVAAIYGLATPTSPFLPVLTAAPNDWTVAIAYTGGINQAQGLAIDSVGNIWISNLYNNNVEEFSNTGALLSPISGYTAANLYHPQRVAIDLSGNIWTPGQIQQDPVTFQTIAPGTLAKFSSNGTVLSGTGFTGGGYSSAFGILVDGANNVWTGSNRLSEFTNAGVPISPSTGFTGGGLGSGLTSIALDSVGNVWASIGTFATVGGVQTHTGTLAKFSSTGAALSPSTGYTGGGLYYPEYLAVDGSNNLWSASYYGASTGQAYGTLAEFNSSGAALSPSIGYANTGAFPDGWVFVDGAGNIWASNGCSANYPCTLTELNNAGVPISGTNGYSIPNSGFAPGIDSSGNLWISGITTVMEIVGVAAPTVTPLVKAVTTGKLGTRP